ncbi:MAG TPA: hypothetical protein VH572_00905 [Gaiella sp.]|jgi:hypothetical protein
MKSVMVRLRLLLPLLAVLLAFVAAGCGGSSGSSEPMELQSLVGVADRSTKADTGRFEMVMRMSAPGLPGEFEIGASGAFDRLVERAQMTLDMSALVELIGSLGGKSTPDLGDPADWKLDVVQDGTVFYLRLPQFLAKQVPGGKTWVKGDVATLTKTSGSLLGGSGFTGGDPRDVIRFLKAVAGDVQAVGREDVRGVSTSHYRATLDMQKLLGLAAGSSKDSLVNIDSMVQQAGVSSIPVDVWVDDESLLRRMEMTFAMSPAGAGGSANFSLSFDLFDYGKPLFIELPPADQVADAATLQLGS